MGLMDSILGWYRDLGGSRSGSVRGAARTVAVAEFAAIASEKAE